MNEGKGKEQPFKLEGEEEVRSSIGDFFNQWWLALKIEEFPDLLDRVHPMKTFEERIREKKHPQGELIISISDPEIVQAYNEVVAKFNAELPKLKEAGNCKEIAALAKKAMSLLKKESSQ